MSSAGPEEDSEEESDLSITELKALSQEKAKKRLEEKLAKDQKIKVGSQIIVSFCYFYSFNQCFGPKMRPLLLLEPKKIGDHCGGKL